MNKNTFSEQIEQFISKDDMKSAITLLSKLLKNSPKLDEVILQSARFNDISKQIRLDLIDFEQATITKNKIRYAVLDMVRDIEESVENNPKTQQEVERFSKSKELLSLKGDNNIIIQGIKSGKDTSITIGRNRDGK